MSSARADEVIREFLVARGGSANAGDVVGHAAGLGIPASTLRRAADRVIVKTRSGNRFVWSLPTEPASPSTESAVSPAAADADPFDEVSRSELLAECKRLGLEIYSEGQITESELTALIEDAGTSRPHGSHAEPPAERTAPATSRRSSKRRTWY